MPDLPKLTLPFTPTNESFALLTDLKQAQAVYERAQHGIRALRDSLIAQAPNGMNPELMPLLLGFAMSNFLAQMLASKPEDERQFIIKILLDTIGDECRAYDEERRH